MVISIKSNSPNQTLYRQGTNSGATETISLSYQVNGFETLAIAGCKTTTDVLTLTVYDAGLSSGSELVNYTVQAADTLNSIATNIAAAINADVNLQNVGVTAAANSTVVFIKSTSINMTTYAQSKSGGATENLVLGTSTNVAQSGYNNVNELTGISAGGPTRFQGTTNKPVKSVTINGGATTLIGSQSFTGNPSLASGTNSVSVQGTDGANNTKTNVFKSGNGARPTIRTQISRVGTEPVTVTTGVLSDS